MTLRLNNNDRNILEFRPEIDFVEPDVEPQTPNEIEQPAETPQVEDARFLREEVKRLAQAVNILAAAVQSRADQRAKNMVINLDPKIDADTIQAMKRKFPGEDPNKITYEQYRNCKDFIRDTGEKIGRKASISPDEVDAARDEAINSKKAGSKKRSRIGGNSTIVGLGAQLGGFNTPESRNGGLDPELNNRARIFDAIDINDFQVTMICVLVNWIWQTLMFPIFLAAKIPVAGISIGSILPKRLCDPKIDIEIPGLLVLGLSDFKKPQQPKIPEEGPEI